MFTILNHISTDTKLALVEPQTIEMCPSFVRLHFLQTRDLLAVLHE
jgi:hypothetical protein